MALILNIDTATEAGSVCLARDGVSLAAKINTNQKDHAAVIAPFIHEILQESHTAASQIQAVAVSAGPGSYTGLRVAAATAKGLCYAWGIPLIAVNTLEMMANGMRMQGGDALQCVSADILFCPMIDARRMDVFTALYDAELRPLRSPAAVTLDDTFPEEYRHRPVRVFGTGMAKARKLFSAATDWHFHEFTCHASFLAALSEGAFQRKQFQDVAYFEPYYLKSFYSPAGPKA